MPHIALADFLRQSPEDLSPIAFFEVFRGEQGRQSLQSIYISLFSEAMGSQDPSIVQHGQEMKRRWAADRTVIQKYWREVELETIQVCNTLLCAISPY